MHWGAAKEIWKRVEKRHVKPESRDAAKKRSDARLTVHYKTETQKKAIHDLCLSQEWPNLEIKNNIPGAGRGVTAMTKFLANDLIADYHGDQITPEASDELMREPNDDVRTSDYLMKMPCGIHIDAHLEHCGCHSKIRTYGRLFNWSDARDKAKTANMKTHFYTFHGINGGTQQGLLFVANRDIAPLEELRYDYGDANCREMFK
jgi:hypothetical protein